MIDFDENTFPQGTVMSRGSHSGQDKHRTSKLIKAGHFFRFLGRLGGLGGLGGWRLMSAMMMLAAAPMAAAQREGSICIDGKALPWLSKTLHCAAGARDATNEAAVLTFAFCVFIGGHALLAFVGWLWIKANRQQGGDL